MIQLFVKNADEGKLPPSSSSIRVQIFKAIAIEDISLLILYKSKFLVQFVEQIRSTIPTVNYTTIKQFGTIFRLR